MAASGPINGIQTAILVDTANVPVGTVAAPLVVSAPAGGATEAKQDAAAVLVGAVTETAPANDTASSGLNGRLQRIAQRLTSLVTGVVLAAGSALIGKVDHSSTGIGDGHKEVTTAGTRVALAASTAAKWVTVQAYRANTSTIAVGGAGSVVASATIGTGTGISLAAGESITLAIDNLADVGIDSIVNGEGVRFVYGT